MKAGTRMNWVMQPFTKPSSAPVARVARSATSGWKPSGFARSPETMEQRPTTKPSERLIPPVMSTSVMPTQAMAGMADCLTMSRALALEAKRGTVRAATRARTARMMKLPLSRTKPTARAPGEGGASLTGLVRPAAAVASLTVLPGPPARSGGGAARRRRRWRR